MSVKPRKALTIANIPELKKAQPATPRKLGLIHKEAGKMCSFRLRFEAIEALEELFEKINKRSNIKISRTQILELLVIDAHKNPARINSLLNS